VTLWNIAHGSIDWAALRWLPPGVGFPLDIWQLFSVIPTIATAFTCHYNCEHCEKRQKQYNCGHHAITEALQLGT